MATLGTTCINYATSTFGGHAGTETMVALTLDDTGLKRAFHV